jgi:SAM-dependent methyltransferase
MGIFKSHIHTFCMEYKNTAKADSLFSGDVLTFGQQAVYSSIGDVRKIIAKYDYIDIKELPDNFDTSNKIPSWEGTPRAKNTNAQSLFQILGADNVYVADISDYENPDFLIDLNYPVDPVYHDRFDTIVDVGTLEHLFDVPTALENIIKMLKDNGTLVSVLPSSNLIDHGFYSFSPTLFYDYFKSNGFNKISCYLREYSPFIYEKKGRLYKYKFVDREIPIISSNSVELTFIATKTDNCDSNNILKPIQGIYQKSKYWNNDKFDIEKKWPNHLKKTFLLVLFYIGPALPKFIVRIIYNKGRITRKNIHYLGRY